MATTALLKRRRTKIVATLGPTSSGTDVIAELIARGVDVFRLNMSHGSHETHAALFQRVRQAAAEGGAIVGVLADLCGPKIRVGRFESGQIELVPGSQVTVTTREVVGRPGLIPSQYPDLAHDVRPGARVLLADALLELRVDAVDGTEVSCTVVNGGVLSDRKGINLPDVEMSAGSLTEKDVIDARFALSLGVDYLALSFVRRASDVLELRSLVPGGQSVGIIAKIERPEALDGIEAILEVSDGIMVARGDLGAELPPERVPVAQRQLIAYARSAAQPSIVATQMLESMVEHPRPTRAEVSDVSTAVFGGADAVMLSAETASGRYPVGAVAMMDRVAREVEGYLWSENGFRSDAAAPRTGSSFVLHEAMGRSTAQLSRDLQVRAIVVLSRTGTTARMVSSARPAAPVLAATGSATVARQMTLLWGVVPCLVAPEALADFEALATRLALGSGLAQTGQRILIVTGGDFPQGGGPTDARSGPGDRASITVVSV